jgi:hypothetical protein
MSKTNYYFVIYSPHKGYYVGKTKKGTLLFSKQLDAATQYKTRTYTVNILAYLTKRLPKQNVYVRKIYIDERSE